MERHRGFSRHFIGWAFASLLGALLCCVQGVSALEEKEATGALIDKVGLLPFFKGVMTYSVSESVNCPVCQLAVEGDEDSPDAERVLTELVQVALEKRFHRAAVPLSTVRGVYDALPKDEAKDTAISLAQRTGRALEASHVMVGFVWRFRERVGGSMGVDRPASVAFLLHLVEVSSGAVVWKGTFNETQRSLSENILDAPAFFKRGAKWLTAEELARSGIEGLFRKMPF